MNFKKITAVLDLHERVLQIYFSQDLMEVCLLSGYENEWKLVDIEGEKIDFNVFKNKEGIIKLQAFETGLNEKNEIVTNKTIGKFITLNIE